MVDDAGHTLSNLNGGRPVKVNNDIGFQSSSPYHGESPEPSGSLPGFEHKTGTAQLTSVNRSAFARAA
jgi:hypothetical protein